MEPCLAAIYMESSAHLLTLWWSSASRRWLCTAGQAARLCRDFVWKLAATTARGDVRWRQRSRISHRHAVGGLAARGGSGVVMQHRGCSWSIPRAATMLPLPHPRPSVCRHPCHECSHGIPHSRLFAIACQVGVWLQRLSYESILSIPSLRDSWAVTVALESKRSPSTL